MAFNVPLQIQRPVFAVALFASVACVPLRLTTYSYEKEIVVPSANRRVSFELKPDQPASLGPPSPTFLLLLAVESDSLVHLDPKLLRTELRGVVDSSVHIITTPAEQGVDPTGRIRSLMHFRVPLAYQQYTVTTLLEWTVDGRRDSLTTTWIQKPAPRRSWFFWPWQMYTDG